MISIRVAGIAPRDSLILGTYPVRSRQGTGHGPTVRRDSIAVLLFDMNGKQRVQTMVLPDVFVASDTRIEPDAKVDGAARVHTRDVAPGPVTRHPSPFAPFVPTTIALVRGHAVHLDESTDDLLVFSASAKPVQRILLPPLSPEQRPLPDGSRVRPASETQVLELRTTRSGGLLVELPRDSLNGERRWLSLDESNHSTLLTGPSAGTRVLEAASDYALLLARDSNDLERVKVCRIGR
jgi:hypothetical protein